MNEDKPKLVEKIDTPEKFMDLMFSEENYIPDELHWCRKCKTVYCRRGDLHRGEWIKYVRKR